MPKQNLAPADYPQAVLQQIAQLGQNIALARKRRGESQAQWAKKLGVSQPTMARIERGDPAVAMASYVMCMWLIQPMLALADGIAPQNDLAALEQELAALKKSRYTQPSPSAALSVQEGAAPQAQHPAAGLAALLAKTSQADK